MTIVYTYMCNLYMCMCVYIYACIYVRMCLCNDDLAHVINQSAILSLPLFFFLFFFYISLAHGFEPLARWFSWFQYIFFLSLSLFLLLLHLSRFIRFYLFGTRKMENNYTYISRASMHLCDSINFECAIFFLFIYFC